MENYHNVLSMPDSMPWFVWVLLIGASLLGLFLLFFRNIGPTQIAIKERRYYGARMPAGRVVAGKGEVGIQGDVLKPGLHFIAWPIESIVEKAELIDIGNDEMGIVEAIDGAPLPEGRIYAPDVGNNQHQNFQDPIAFLANGGYKGIQLRTLGPGKWPIHPYLFKVSICKVTVVPNGQIGIVTAFDGNTLDTGRLLAKSVAGHNHFQNGEAFIAASGQKGVQREILTPGTYRIMRESADKHGARKTGLFDVEFAEATKVSENSVGLIEALDGASMDPADYVARPVNGHNNFQDADAFLSAGGQRGPQKDILLPGTYYINPRMFKFIPESAKEVKAGEVAVIISNCGMDPTTEIRRQMDEEARQKIEQLKLEHGADEEEVVGEDDGKPVADPADKRLDSGISEAYVVPDGYRGIQKSIVGPGRYYVNTQAVTPHAIPTTNQTVEWTEGQQSGTFDPFEVVSKDGFKIRVEVRVVFRVKPEDAPFMVSKIGSLDNLRQNVMHPTIDSIFRNQASESSAMAYLQNRHEEQLKAETKVRAHLVRYHVEVINVLICHIHLPDDLMETQTKKVLAVQQTTMFEEQEKAQVARIELEKTTARAQQQGNLMKATVGVEIAKQDALARIEQANGEATYTRETGFAAAEVTEKQLTAAGAGYKVQQEALGQGGLAMVEALKQIADGSIKITPDFLVSGGGDGGNGGGLGQALLAMIAANFANLNGFTGNATPASPAVTAPEGKPAASSEVVETTGSDSSKD